MAQQQGGLIQEDFFDHSGGLNNTDSPFRVQANQAIDGYGYDYTATGGLSKRYGHTVLNSTPDSQVQSMGYFMHTTANSVKTLLRAAGEKLQTVNQSTGVSTNLAGDGGGAPTDFFTDSSIPVVFSQFNTASNNTTWCAGGGLPSGTLIGNVDGVVTVNGSATPAGTLGLTPTTSGGALPDDTSYYYAVSLVKDSTGAESNAGCDSTATTGSSGSDVNKITIDLTSISTFDQTKYSSINIYRSNVDGVLGFTIGDLIATVASNATSYEDTGAIQGTAEVVPRENNVNLDNSVLPAGTYKTLTTWKRRLVTAYGSTVCISDLNRPESWPSQNRITVPSGGHITALGIISFSTPTTSSNDEFLVVFKQKEVWVITGETADDWQLKFIDSIGCIAQPLLVLANGFLAWVDTRGVYLWDGSYKPIYCSRPIESDFKIGGDIDLSELEHGWGTFFRKQNEIVWTLSSIRYGTQKLSLKLDVRLTYPNVSDALAGRVMEGVFIKDVLPIPLYGGTSTIPTTTEVFYAGDDAGNTYTLFDNINQDTVNVTPYWDQAVWDTDHWDARQESANPIPFRYRSRPLDFGMIGTAKRYHKVIVWCKESTTSKLTLNYWVSYKNDNRSKATQQQQIAKYSTNAYWDQGSWDQAEWDAITNSYVPVVFNLGNSTIGIEGDCLTLEFIQSELNSAVTIAGFSVIYSQSGLRK